MNLSKFDGSDGQVPVTDRGPTVIDRDLTLSYKKSRYTRVSLTSIHSALIGRSEIVLEAANPLGENFEKAFTVLDPMFGADSWHASSAADTDMAGTGANWVRHHSRPRLG